MSRVSVIDRVQCSPIQIDDNEPIIDINDDIESIANAIANTIQQNQARIEQQIQQPIQQENIQDTQEQKEIKQLEEQFEQSAKYLNQLKNNEKEWKQSKHKKSTKGFTRKSEKKLIFAKGETIIQAPIQNILKVLTDPSKVKVLSPGTISDVKLQDVNEKLQIRLNTSHVPLLDDRTSCFLFGTKFNNNEYQVISKSVNNYKQLKLKKSQTLCYVEQCWYLSQINEKECKLILISAIDPAGNIPNFLKNMINNKRGFEAVLDVKNHCEQEIIKLNKQNKQKAIKKAK